MSFRPSLAQLPTALAAAFLALLTPLGASAQASILTLTTESAPPDTVRVSSDAYRVRFDLTQLGADSATVEVACTGMGAVACAAVSGSRLRLGAGSPSVLAFDVQAVRPGRGLVMVRARDPVTGARASVALLVTVTP